MEEFNRTDISNVVQTTELGDTLKELNSDDIEHNTRMSRIDLKTRLHPFEINSILAIDTLVGLGVLPSTCLAFTRQKKRLNVSLNGLGRREMVEVVAGKREMDLGTKQSKLASFFGAGKDGQN